MLEVKQGSRESWVCTPWYAHVKAQEGGGARAKAGGGAMQGLDEGSEETESDG